jgi:hypothetical protein
MPHIVTPIKMKALRLSRLLPGLGELFFATFAVRSS